MGRALLVFSLLVPLAGCGSGGSSGRYALSGAVTYDGKPVPAGRIALEPDTEKGNSGPGGFAEIKNGRFQTTRAMGSVGGPHIARFVLGDGANPNELLPHGRLLVTDPVVVKVDLPRAAATHDFAIPAADKPQPR